MLWRGRQGSDNIEDRRGIGGKGLGVGGLLIGAAVVYLLGGDPVAYLARNANRVDTAAPVNRKQDDERKDFASVVLAETESSWRELFAQEGKRYVPPKLVLFRNRVESACGAAGSATGPFYCPLDRKVYLDLSFFDDLTRSLGAKGDFAAAYVIAHEVGHHVQNLLGYEEVARRAQRGLSDPERNKISVGIELQADCLAGVWAHSVAGRGLLEAGDVEEAVGAAGAVGDDRLQEKSRGEVTPDSFTHGSSAQRIAALRRGLAGGNLAACARGA